MLLLLPMLFSGLAMVCAEPEPVTEEIDVTAAVVSEGVPGECDGTMCRMLSMLGGPGPVCLLTSSGAGIAVFDLGLAIPCLSVEIHFQLPVIYEPVTENVSLYSTPSLPNLTPPPRA